MLLFIYFLITSILTIDFQMNYDVKKIMRLRTCLKYTPSGSERENHLKHHQTAHTAEWRVNIPVKEL